MSEWILETGTQLFVSLFGDGDRARHALQHWIYRRSSEFFGLSATMAFSDSLPVGLISALLGDEVAGFRCFRLDVEGANKLPSICSESFGLQPIHKGLVSRLGLEMCSMLLQR
jgi:hypothetical protein